MTKVQNRFIPCSATTTGRRFGWFSRAILLCLLLAVFACAQESRRKEMPKAIKGQLDLAGWDFSTDGPVRLSGEWEFYWGRLVDSVEISTGRFRKDMSLIQVPGIWNGHEVHGVKIPGFGYATYHLIVHGMPRGERMAFQFLSMGTAYRMYVDGKEVGTDGVVGTTPDTMVPDWTPHVTDFTPGSNDLDIILQVSNFHHRKGGAFGVIKLGIERDIRAIRDRGIAFDLFLCGSIFIMGLYHFALFLISRRDRAPLYFGIFCLLISLYGLLSGERYFAHLFPDTDWEFRVRLTNLTSFLSVPVFVLFIRRLFPDEFERLVQNVLVVSFLVLSSVVLVTPARVYSYIIPVFHVFTLLAAIYTIYSLVLAIKRKRDGALILFAGTCVIVAAIVNDILYDNLIIRTGQFIHLGLFLFIFFQSVILSIRFSRAFDTIERQRQELAKTNYDIMQEIGMREKTEAALKESEEKYRLLIENAVEAIFILQDNFITYHNTRTEELTGYSADELAMIPFAEHLHPADMERMITRYVMRLAGEPVPPGTSFRVRAKSGEERWVAINAVRITWEGRPAVLCFALDVTQEKALEADLERAHKMEAIGALAGGVAHDLNNVLSGIVSYPDLLLMQLQHDSPLRAPIETIKQTGQKAAAIVMDLLTLARRGVTVREVVNLNDVVREYLKSPEYLKLLSFHKKVRVRTALSEDLLNMKGSPFHLSKTVMNLVSNAVEAMPDGGDLVVSTENRYMEKPMKNHDQLKEGDYVVLAITDTGVGISPVDREKIFEPFYTKKVMGRSGTGLGMAVVWWTVKDHNGHIDLTSNVGSGTTFTIYFPATREELDRRKTLRSIDEYKGRGETILVVDDAKEQREIASAILTELGYSVETMPGGEAAVEYLKSHRIDLVVLDMIMDPGIDGLETYKRIHKDHPGQKAIITSGYSETDRVREAHSLGVGTYLKKPYTLEALGLAVRRELDRTHGFQV